MLTKIRTVVAGRGLVVLPALALLMLFLLPTAVSHAWQGPGHQLDAMEKEVFDLVNQERAKVHLKPYYLNYSLEEAAWHHTEHMAAAKVMCHEGCGDGTPWDRIKATGYKYTTAGENVASGQRTSTEVMDAWMHSSGHKANILNKGYTDIGVAFAPAGLYGTSWTQVFGAPQSGYATITPPAGGGGGGGGPTPVPCTLKSDVNGDGKVANDDVQAVAMHAGARVGDPRYEARYDVTDDGVINVYDTFKVVMAVGQSCSG